jgi:hypothetical protein
MNSKLSDVASFTLAAVAGVFADGGGTTSAGAAGSRDRSSNAKPPVWKQRSRSSLNAKTRRPSM